MKRLQIAGVVLASVVVVWLVVHLGATPEPQYQGRMLSEWLEQGMALYQKFPNSKDAENNSEWIACKAAVNQIGTNGVPFLLDDLLFKESKIKSEISDLSTKAAVRSVLNQKWLGRLDAIAITDEEKTAERNARGYFGFYLLAENAQSARPRLLELIKEIKDSRRGLLIISYGVTKPPKEELVPVAVQWMKSSDLLTRVAGEEILRGLYPEEATNNFTP